jgi:hypothetical protein
MYPAIFELASETSLLHHEQQHVALLLQQQACQA